MLVAGPGGAPGLEDYEPSVLLYTTPRHVNFFEITCQLRLTDTSGVIIVTFTLHRVLRDTTPRFLKRTKVL